MTKQFSNYSDLLTFTRASKGHALRPVSYGTQLVENGTFNSDLSDWTDDLSKWSVSGSRAYHAPNSTFAVLRQSVPLTVGKVYRITFDYEVLQGQLRCQARDSSNQPNGDTLAIHDLTGTGSASVIFVPDADYDSIGFARDDPGVTGEMYVDNVSVKEVLFDQPDGTLTLFEHPDNVPRVEWDADRNRLGLLVEEQRINLVPYSNFSSDWGETRSTLTTNALASPDGQLNGASIKANTDSNSHYIADTISISSSTRYTSSVFFKAGGKNWATIYNGAGNVYFDLENGVIGDITGTNNTTAQIQEIGNGWYRCSISFDASASATSYNFAIGPALANGDNTYVGDNSTEEIYVYGAQVEQASFPTSYMKNEGTSSGVTRSADVASIPVADFGWNNGAGTVVAEVDTADASNFGILWSANADSFQNRTLAYINNDLIYMYNRKNNGTEVNDPYANAPLDNTPLKHGYAFTDGDFNHTLNGGAVETVASNEMPVGINSFDIGNRLYTSGGHLNGHIKKLMYIPRRVTNAQLISLTE